MWCRVFRAGKVPGRMVATLAFANAVRAGGVDLRGDRQGLANRLRFCSHPWLRRRRVRVVAVLRSRRRGSDRPVVYRRGVGRGSEPRLGLRAPGGVGRYRNRERGHRVRHPGDARARAGFGTSRRRVRGVALYPLAIGAIRLATPRSLRPNVVSRLLTAAFALVLTGFGSAYARRVARAGPDRAGHLGARKEIVRRSRFRESASSDASCGRPSGNTPAPLPRGRTWRSRRGGSGRGWRRAGWGARS